MCLRSFGLLYMLKPSCLMVETYKWNEVLTIMYSMMEKHTFFFADSYMFMWKKFMWRPSGQKYNQSNLCYSVLTVCLKFLCTTQHPQYIHVECKQLKPHYVGPLRLSLDHFTSGRESFPRAALSAPRCSPTTPHHLWLHKAGRAPGARPTSLHRYFLRKTHHLRLDPSVGPLCWGSSSPSPQSTAGFNLTLTPFTLFLLPSTFFSFSFPLVFLASFHSPFLLQLMYIFVILELKVKQFNWFSDGRKMKLIVPICFVIAVFIFIFFLQKLAFIVKLLLLDLQR